MTTPTDDLAQALERTARHRAASDGIDPDQWRAVLFAWEKRALEAHESRAQPASIHDCDHVWIEYVQPIYKSASAGDVIRSGESGVKRYENLGFMCDKCGAVKPAQPASMAEWQPIETAPKDGRRMLLARQNGHAAFYGFFRVAAQGWVDDALCARDPTHWMPLPLPPRAAPQPAQESE